MARFGRGRSERRHTPSPADLLVVGLGNPGREYVGTRHNVGAEVIDVLVERHDGRLRRSKELSLSGELRIGDKRLAVAFPQTYMNESGNAVQLLARRYDIDDPESIVIVHDELDLDVGRLKIKRGGGLAGHNGLRSIKASLGTDAFLRVRIGVGKPPSREAGRHHVLKRPPKAVRTELDVSVQVAADAVERIVLDGVDAAMADFNRSAPDT